MHAQPRMRLLAPQTVWQAWRNLSQFKLRTALSVLGVALGVSMIVGASTAADSFRTMFTSEEARQNFAFMFDAFEDILNITGAVILLVAGFLIYNAFAMAVTQRRRQMGILRSLGMTSRQVLWLVLTEALITGIFGTVLGILLGPVWGAGVTAMLKAGGFDVIQGRMQPESIPTAALLALGLIVLAVVIPARRAGRTSPLEAIQQAHTFDTGTEMRGRLAAGGLVISALLGGYLVIAPPGEWVLPPWNLVMPAVLTLVWLAAAIMMLPAIISATGRALVALSRLTGITLRLSGDNLRRDRQRVFWTTLTLGIGIAMIVAIKGLFLFSFTVLFRYLSADLLATTGWYAYPDLTSVEPTIENFALKPEILAEAEEVIGDRAIIGGYTYVFVPEISTMIENFPSLFADTVILKREGGFSFSEGSWEQADPIMAQGCGLLLTPGVAVQHGVSVGDELVVQGRDGPVSCTVAGIGSGGVAYPTSYISVAAKDQFPAAKTPSYLYIGAKPGTDVLSLEADLRALNEKWGLDFDLQSSEEEIATIEEIDDMLVGIMEAMMTFAIIAATMGVINTTVMSVTERRQELALMRAVGASRRQVRRMVVGEAFTMGLIGGVFGLVVGGAASVIGGVAQGGLSYGLVNLPLWQAAWEATQPALQTGLYGVIVTPFISAAASLIPTRSALRMTVVDMLNTEHGT